VNTRFSFHSASQSYNGLDNVQQGIVQNFKDALTLRGLVSPNEYLTDVVRGITLLDGAFTFSNVYKGEWKGGQVAVKKFHLLPPVFLISVTLSVD
jgi:hypothetical protein